MRFHHVAVLLGLALWQTAPVPTAPDSNVRLRVSIAGAGGEWADFSAATTNCYGNPLTPERRAVGFANSYGGRVDVYLGREGKGLLTLVGGRMDADSTWLPRGTFCGAQAAWEDRNAGIGVGVRQTGDAACSIGGVPFASPNPTVAFYLRAGRAENLHLRLEISPLSETPSLAGDARVGVGFGQGRRDPVHGFMGMTFGPAVDGRRAHPYFVEMGSALAPLLDVLVRGQYGSGHGTAHWGAGAGLRLVF